ncbi:hypothetical protein PIROE2DRAFT_34416, partial [Piromyces sp. E2]
LGHAFHALSSNTKYGSFNMMNVEHDFIEVPSKMAENWAFEPEIIEKVSQHYQDPNKKMPKNLIESIIQINKITNSISKIDNIYKSLFDMKIHSIEEYDENIDFLAMWNKEQKEMLGIGDIDNTKSVTTFAHIVNGYDAGYYGYL